MSAKQKQKFKLPSRKVLIWAGATLTLILIYWLAARPFTVKGISMNPTLAEDDYLIVNLASRSWAGLVHQDFIPKAGSVVVFHDPQLPQDTPLVKRVIATPGDKVSINLGAVRVNGKLQDDPPGYTEGAVELVVPAGHVYVLGDNRAPAASRDSRLFGPVSASDLIGTVSLRLFPVDKLKIW